MQTDKKHVDVAVLFYFGFLLIVVANNIISKISLIDLVYLIVILCCFLRYFIIRNSKK